MIEVAASYINRKNTDNSSWHITSLKMMSYLIIK
jgi:hypothetical protein